MKIKQIEFENFRNFKNRGLIKCSTDGKVTIVYGKNGDGKTTLHQLLYWIFYNRVNFNRTTNEDKLYNLEYEKTSRYGDEILTWGQIDFEHNGEEYALRREWRFKKEIQRLRKVHEEVELMKREETGWKSITKNPNEVEKKIENILPSGLSEYFFFDGESMIADLKVKGKESANKLKEALFSIFDLTYLDNGIRHIGNSNLSGTVISKLFAEKKGSSNNEMETNQSRQNMLNALERINKLDDDIKDIDLDINKNTERIKEISEEIGAARSNRDYENQRRIYQNSIEDKEKDIKATYKKFGEDIYKVFPKLLIKKRFSYAQLSIKKQMEENGHNLPQGLEKELVQYLLSPENDTCICGRKLGNTEREILEKLKFLFPPYSYTHIYNRLINSFSKVGSDYDNDLLSSSIGHIIDRKDEIDDIQKSIKDLDDEKKSSQNIQGLINERIELESKNDKLNDKRSDLNGKCSLAKRIYNQEKKKYDSFTKDIKTNKIIENKINLIEKVKKELEKELDETKIKYSKKLEEHIEFLLEKMLTSKRKVTVSDDFFVKVYDSYDDESKSEGQFAVVSFAYIGAIMKMLKEEEMFQNKEYPLVLDGPFSKLDEEQKNNIINVIPKFAPQIILFSKDDLSEYFDENDVGNVWTIISNEEKNKSYVEEGYKWKQKI